VADSELADVFGREAGYDVVLDHVWDRPTEVVDDLTGHDVTAEASRTRLVQIGEVKGPNISLPAGRCEARG
jgi:NADPH2:quinone reductase